MKSKYDFPYVADTERRKRRIKELIERDEDESDLRLLLFILSAILTGGLLVLIGLVLWGVFFNKLEGFLNWIDSPYTGLFLVIGSLLVYLGIKLHRNKK